MKVTVEGEIPKDFPNLKRIELSIDKEKVQGNPDPKFIAEMKKTVARRLELRPEDVVVIIVKDGNTTYTFKDKE